MLDAMDATYAAGYGNRPATSRLWRTSVLAQAWHDTSTAAFTVCSREARSQLLRRFTRRFQRSELVILAFLSGQNMPTLLSSLASPSAFPSASSLWATVSSSALPSLAACLLC